MDERSQGSGGRRLSGTPVLIDAWESGLLRQDSVPGEIWEAANERLLSLEAEVTALEEAKCNAEKECDLWVTFHKRASENFEKGMRAYRQEADVQARCIVEATEIQRNIEQELMEVEKEKGHLKEEVAELERELSILEARPLDVEIDEMRSLAAEVDIRYQEAVDMSSDLDIQIESMEQEIEGLKSESASKDKELILLNDSISSLQSRQENLEVREQQAEMDRDELNLRERALDVAAAKLNQEKLQACQKLRLEKPRDLDMEIARLSGKEVHIKRREAIEEESSPVRA